MFRVSLLGCARFGSPGIFGVPTTSALCEVAESQQFQSRSASAVGQVIGRVFAQLRMGPRINGHTNQQSTESPAIAGGSVLASNASGAGTREP